MAKKAVKTTARQSSLLADLTKDVSSPRFWFTNLPRGVQDDLREVRTWWHAEGKTTASMARVYEWCKGRFQLEVCRHTFAAWIKEIKRNG